jgi:hypothetical protein
VPVCRETENESFQERIEIKNKSENDNISGEGLLYWGFPVELERAPFALRFRRRLLETVLMSNLVVWVCRIVARHRSSFARTGGVNSEIAAIPYHQFFSC